MASEEPRRRMKLERVRQAGWLWIVGMDLIAGWLVVSVLLWWGWQMITDEWRWLISLIRLSRQIWMR